MKDTAVIFDLDGTLLDSLEDIKDSVNAVLRRHGYGERSLEEIRSFVGNGAERLIRLAAPEGCGEIPQLLAGFREHYQMHCRDKTKPYDGIPEAIEKLAESYPLAIVSNKPDESVKTLCGVLFPGVYALGETANCRRKPAPDMILRTMEILGTPRCIYVGDSEVDIAAAKNTGVPCISVLWGFADRKSLEEAGAAHLCESPAQLPALVEQMEEIYGK